MAKKNLKDPLESYKQARKVAADAGYKPAQKEQQEEAASNAPWYRGNTPTASEMIARANTLYAGDEVKRDEVLGKIERRMNTPGSGVYNPYRTATNTGLIDSLTALGIDTSGGINDDFFAANAGYQKYLRLSAASGTPSAPTKKSTNEERAAYYLYQLQKDEATTNEAETEWTDMQKEISYWVGKGYSDDEVLAKVNADGKYATLKKMNDAAGMGAPTALNRAVGYSKDAQYGAIWAARNGGGSGDAFQDSVSYASGVGKRYNADKTLEARRDVTSKDYMPYADGSTLDDANMFFGVTSFDQDWINANKGLLNGTDSTAAKYFKQVYQAEQTTQEAEQERAGVYAWIDAMQRQGLSADKISDLLESMYDDPSSTDAVHMSALKKMDEGRRSGDPVALTRSVDWRLEDTLAYIRQGSGTSGAKGKREAVARLTAAPEAETTPAPDATPEQPEAPTQQQTPSPVQSGEAMAQVAAARAQADNATVAQQGEAEEAVREQTEAERQRAQLVEEYNTELHNAEVNGSAQSWVLDELRGKIDALTADIGDGFTLRTDYTLDAAEAVLQKAFAGRESLTDEEQAIFSNFYQDYGALFGTAGFEGEGFRDYGLALEYGKTASEALTWADSPEATTQDSASTIMQIVRDSQSAKAAGMSLDDWYAENPEAEARLMQVREDVQATRQANTDAKAAQQQQEREDQLAYNVHVLQQVASGAALDETDQAAYDRIMAIDAKQLLSSDPSYAAKIDALYGVSDPSAMLEKLGLTYDQEDFAPGVADSVEAYYATDAKLAASVGLTLDELYAQYPSLNKSESTVIEQAKQDYLAKWEQPDADTPEAEGLGFFRTLALGADSGWNGWVAGKIAFYQALTTHDDSTTVVDNYDVYVRQYGIAGARRAYSKDVASAIYNMSDDDPLKAQYAQEFADAQNNGTDIFMLPFNFTAETLRQARQKFESNVQNNADVINEYGTWAEKCLLYPITENLVSNSLNMAESALVGGVTGSTVAGTTVGYGLSQFGQTKLEAMDKGLTSAQATLVGLLDAGATVALESPMMERYMPHLLSGAIEDAVSATARKEGMSFFARAGAWGREMLANAGAEVIQENTENIVSGAIKGVAYGDVSEFTSQFAPETIWNTSFMAFVTALGLSAEGKGFNALRMARARRTALKQQQTVTTTEQTVEQQTAQQEQTAQEAPQSVQEAPVPQEANIATEQEQTAQTDAQEAAQATQELVAEILASSEGQQQIVEARAAQIVHERVGLGELNTEQISQLTDRAQETENALLTARNTQAAQKQELQKVQAVLQKANQRAATKQGAKTISQYAPKAANLREALRVSNQQVQEAQQAYQTARQELQQARQAAYTQLQQQAMTQAQQEIQQAAELMAEATMTEDSVQEIQSQQQQADAVEQTSAPDAAQALKAARSAYYQARKQGKALQTQKQQLTAQLQGHLQAVRVAEQNGSDVSAFAQSLEQITGALTEVDNQIQQQAQVIKDARAEMNRLAAGGQENAQQTQGAQNAPQTVQEAPQTAQAGQAAGQAAEVVQGQNEAPVTAAEQTQGYPYKDDTAPEAGEDTAQRQWGLEGAQRSQVLPQGVKDYVVNHNEYYKDSNTEQVNRALARIETAGETAALSEWMSMDENEMGNADAQAMGNVLMALACQRGDATTQCALVERIADKYNRIGTVAGQALQARKICDMMTPQGAALYVQHFAKKMSKQFSSQKTQLDLKVSPETMQQILTAETLEERQSAVDAAGAEIMRQIPPTLVDKLNAWRYLAMLGNPRTHIRNLVGNAVFMPEVGIRNKVAASMQAVAQRMGWMDASERTRNATPVKNEYREFARADAKEEKVVKALKDGEKYLTDSQQGFSDAPKRRSFGNSAAGNVAQALSDFTGNALAAEDMIAKRYYYTRALASYMQAQNMDLQTATEQQLTEARTFAVHEAMKNTYNNRNAMVECLIGLENSLRKWKGGRAFAAAIEGVIPFKNTPANVIARGVEYSPVGLAKTVVINTVQLKKGELSLSNYIDNLASGLTGTGMFALGMWLRSIGAITGSIDNDDEGKFEKLKGEQEYAFRVFGKSYTADWLAPGGISMFTGADFFDMMADSGAFSLPDMFTSLGKITEPVYNLTMLDGINSVFDADSLSEKAFTALQNYLGQFVPTILGQITRTIDPVRRANYTDKNSWIPADIQYFLNKQRNKIPGLSTLSTPYVDAFGRQDVSNNVWLRAFENFISPGYLNDLQENNVTAMIDQVAKESGEDVYPSSVAKYISVNSERKNLTAEQWTQYQTQAGKDLYAALDALSKDADFAGLEPAYQAKAIKNATQYAVKKAQQALYPDVSAAKWITKTETVPEAAREAVSRAHDSMVTDYAEANAKEIVQWAQDGNLEACETLMPIFRELGLKDNEIKSKLAAEAKEVYQKAWLDGDMATCLTLESMLDSMNVGFSSRDYKTWKTDTQKEK